MCICTRSYWLAIISGLMVLLLASMKPIRAQLDVSLSLRAAEQLALESEPGMVAARARAQAMVERSVAAGALPDPQLRFGVMNLPLGAYDFNQEAMTQKQIALQQVLPSAGSRKAMREQMRYQGNAFDYAAAARARQVLRDVRDAWLDVYYWQQAQRIVTENRALLVQLVTVVHAMYAVGRQSQQDMARTELELGRLEDRLLDINEQIRRSRATLAQWVGAEAAMQPVIDGLPDWQGYTDLDTLRVQLLQHPLLQATQARIASANAGVDVAHAKYKPTLGFELAYGQREDDRLGNARDDFLSAMVMLSVPLFTGNRQDKELSAAEQDRVANLSDRDMLLRDLARQLESGFARWQQLQFRIALYNQSIIEQSRIQAEASLRAYQSGTGDFADMMRGYMTDLNTQLEFMRLKTDRAQAYAQLNYLLGEDQHGFSSESRNHD